MKIRYAGTSTIRIFGGLQFQQNEVHEVDDLNTIQEMLTQPGVDFVVADDDPLAAIVGTETAAELTLRGITTPEMYARGAPEQEVGHRTDSG
jgi:hypothetical protein